MQNKKFWPLDYDPEGEIYENPSWDLPGYRQARGAIRNRPAHQRPARRPKTSAK